MHRDAASNTQLLALVAAYFFALIADKAAYIGYLVYAFDEGGSSATALTSIITIVPLFVLGPVVTRALRSARPNRTRGWWHLGQAATLAVAGWSAASGAPLVVVIAASTLAVGASAIMLPAVAMLSPAVVRTADELVTANLWIAYASSVSALIAPLGAAILLAAGGPSAVLLGTATAAALGALATFVMRPLVLDQLAGDLADATGADDPLALAEQPGAGLRTVLRLPGGRAILLAGATHYALLTMVGIVAVVLARSTLGLGDAGPGLLNLAYGVGAFGSSLIAGRALRRQALTPVLVASVAASGLAYLSVAAVPEFAIALIAYLALGVGRVTAESTTRVMLQRVSTPAVMAGAFAVLQAATGIGGIVGSALVQVVFAVAGDRISLVLLGGLLLALAAVLWPMLRRADDATDIPLVEMSLLRRLPIFSGVPEPSLEVLARSAEHTEHSPGEVVVAEGDPGDRYFAIVDGTAEVTIEGHVVRQLERGSGFGEIALLADVPRTATITATTPVRLLGLDRAAFLAAITGSPFAERVAWTGMRHLEFAEGARPASLTEDG